MHPEIYMLASALLGTAIGYVSAAVLANHRMHRIIQDTWAEARRFYLLSNNEKSGL